MEIKYCNGWFRAKKKITKVSDEKKALFAHINRKPYFAVFSDEGQYKGFLEINNDALYVGFLDKFLREYLGYLFIEKEPNKLFLKEAQFWEYIGDTDNKKISTRYIFTQEGDLVIEETDLNNNHAIIKSIKNKIDVSNNYENYPEFGRYESLIKKERSLF